MLEMRRAVGIAKAERIRTRNHRLTRGAARGTGWAKVEAEVMAYRIGMALAKRNFT